MANDIADMLLKIDASTEGLRRQLKKAEDSVNKGSAEIDRNTKKIDRSFSSMGDNVKKVVGGIVAALGAIQIGKKFADIVVETEKLKGSLTTITGSADLAGKAFDKLTDFASQTPFTLDQSVNAFIKLKALGLDPSERAMLSYGNTASAMGKDMMQMIEAVADASTGEFERLKEFGIKAKSEGDRVSLTFQGVTTNIGKNSTEIQEYLLAIGETQFAGAMEDQMERLPGLLSNLQDNVDSLFRKMGDSGGIGVFGAAITAASGAIVYLTDNLDLVATAASAVGASLAVLVGPAAIVGGINMIRNAALALNAAFLANPIAAVVASIAAAAVVIYRHWDELTAVAEKAALNIQLAWNKFKVYLMESFPVAFTVVKKAVEAVVAATKSATKFIIKGWVSIFEAARSASLKIERAWIKLKQFLLDSFAPALDAISRLFTSVQHRAVATWSAIAAAASDPLNAIDTFNNTFEVTLDRLRSGEGSSDALAGSISKTRDRIAEIESELASMNATVVDTDESVADADFSLSQFATTVDSAAASTSEMNKEALKVIGTLSSEKEALSLSSLELDIRNRLQSAGVDRTSELGRQIVALTTEIHNEKQAMADAATEAKALEKANDEAARAAEEAWGRTNNYLAETFIDVFDNGRNAFQNIADSFSAMIKRMVAEWAASKLMNLIGFQGTTSTGAGNPISAITGGLTSSITNSILTGGGGAVTASTVASGVTSAVATGASTVVGGVASAGSAVMGALSAIPGWGWALGGAAVLAKVLDDSGTMSSNAGMLTQDLGHAGSFDIAPFASGAEFTGFARRSDQQGATDNIDAFREIDGYLTNVYKEISGSMPRLNASDFIGYDEKGEGRGAFFGSASEEDGGNGTPMEAQLAKFASRWVELAGAQMGASQDAISHVVGSGSSVAEILQRAGEIGAVDGSHANGLRRVPFDGYRAELHKNEEVLTANDPRNSNNSESMGMLNEMRKIAQSVKTTADLLTRVTRDGNSLVTEPA